MNPFDSPGSEEPSRRRSGSTTVTRLAYVTALGVALASFASLPALTGCGSASRTIGSDSTRATTTGSATVSITWPMRSTSSRLIPVDSNSIIASFSQNGTLITQQIIARPTTGNTTTVTFPSLPTGALTMQAAAYPTSTGTGTAQAVASVPVTIVSGKNTAAAVTMNSTIDHLVVTPASPGVAVGAMTTLVGTAYDPTGAVVLTAASTISWSSSNTAVATVSSTGVVTGVLAGTATITVTESESGKSASTTVTVTGGATGCSSLSGEAAVVCYANDLYNNQGLTTTQKSALQLGFTTTTVTYWSNLPVGSNRNGIPASTFTTTAQQADYIALVKAALNTSDDAGYTTYDEIREADDFLTSYQGTGGGGMGGAYGSSKYYIAFLGTPSTTSPWELQLTGHHGVFNLVYNGAGTTTPITATPNFVGVEPNDITPYPGKTGPVAPVQIPYGETAETATIAPMAARRNAMEAIFTTLQTTDATALAKAKLTESFSDVVYGPSTDAAFVANTKKEGVAISALSTADQAVVIPLVTTAINSYVNTLPESQAATVRSLYESTAALQSTYIGYTVPTGQTAPTPTAQGVYYRIDGPNCWIEFVCQNGVVISSEIHYHSIWRDHKLDYGAEFSSLHQ